MRRPIAGITFVLAVSVSACTSESPTADPPPSDNPSDTSSSGSATASSDAPTEEPNSSSAAPASTFDAFAPAAGPQITGVVSVINAPAGWDDEPLQDADGGNTNGPDGDPAYNVQLGDEKVIGPPETVDELVADSKTVGSWETDLERLPDVQIAGVTGYHLSGTDTIFQGHVDEFAFVVATTQEVQVRITTPPDLAQADRDQIVGTIMASYTLQ